MKNKKHVQEIGFLNMIYVIFKWLHISLYRLGIAYKS